MRTKKFQVYGPCSGQQVQIGGPGVAGGVRKALKALLGRAVRGGAAKCEKCEGAHAA